MTTPTLAPEATWSRGLLIGSEEVPAASGELLHIVNPATGEQLAEVACAGRDDIARAVAVGKDAFASGVWSEAPIH